MKTASFALLLLLSASCIKQTPPVRSSEAAQVAVAYVVDGEDSRAVGAPPEEVMAAVEAELSKRNLVPTRIPHSTVAPTFEGQRDTARRYAHLKTLAGGAPLVLLVELKVAFFSQLTGQYRWRVLGRVTAGKTAETIDPNADSFEKPVFLQFDHQRGREAMMAASPTIAERVGVLFDGFLAPTPAATSSSKGPGLVYFVMVDRFANGDRRNDGEVDPKDPDAFHGGDLQGVIDNLDYLQSLGVETVWLSPVFKMRTEKFFKYGAYHGYWTYDLNQVEPRFGDEELLRKLSFELHARKMKLVLDLVLNHVGPDAPLVKQKPHWFHRQGAIESWDDPVEVVNKDVHGLPDFAQENEEVYQYLLSASLGWIDRVKPDGFRLDAVKHISNAFWARFNGDVRKHAGDDFILLGELLDGDAQKLATSWREGGFTHMFDFPLHFALVDVFCKGSPMSRLSSTLSQDALYPDPGKLVTMVDNHDLPRIAELCDERGMERALSFIFSARGAPSLTWGTEVALKGAKEPHNRADMRFEREARFFEPIQSFARARRQRAAFDVPIMLGADEQTLAFGWLGATGGQLTIIASGDGKAPFSFPKELSSAVRLGLQPLDQRVSGEVTFPLLPAEKNGFAALRERARRQWLEAASKRPVTFSATAPVESGDALFLVGSSEALGAWRVEAAKGPFQGGKLSASLAEGLAYEFKLIIRKKDGRTEWEPGSNRALFIPYSAPPLAVDLAWGKRNG